MALRSRRNVRPPASGPHMKITLLPASLALALPFAVAQPNEQFLRCRGLLDPAVRLACYDAIPVSQAPSSSPGSAAADFGLPERGGEPVQTTVHSSVGAQFDGWTSDARITLENGQVWQIVDGSSGYVGPANRKVVIRRAALGSYRIEFEGLNKSPTVKRIK